ncbi:MAG: hypothetical protein ACM359_07065 [Bacillota bacterium]
MRLDWACFLMMGVEALAKRRQQQLASAAPTQPPTPMGSATHIGSVQELQSLLRQRRGGI